ncbi:hypothetical protein KTT_53020 [Tengunoibacter tsumagoiensis]|uniref:Uncharacterized protein n=1 Tax=Tengunoibacter tsumagoiensis TaxID=2014871 RepID=A0A402A8H9_9CHLR|nr:hypothetical protein KTT_53020 [Tengunoibacter tsumagoiensis]
MDEETCGQVTLLYVIEIKLIIHLTFVCAAASLAHQMAFAQFSQVIGYQILWERQALY